MKTLAERRQARSPWQEGLNMVPYLVLYQRLHRRRWLMGLGALALTATLGVLWARRPDPRLK